MSDPLDAPPSIDDVFRETAHRALIGTRLMGVILFVLGSLIWVAIEALHLDARIADSLRDNAAFSGDHFVWARVIGALASIVLLGGALWELCGAISNTRLLSFRSRLSALDAMGIADREPIRLYVDERIRKAGGLSAPTRAFIDSDRFKGVEYELPFWRTPGLVIGCMMAGFVLIGLLNIH